MLLTSDARIEHQNAITDVTEPAALECGDARYLALIDCLPQMVWIIDSVDRRLIYANEQFRTYFGAAGNDAKTRSARFHPADLAALEAIAPRLDAPHEREVRIIDNDGRYRWHKLIVTCVVRQDAPNEWLASALDIDELVVARDQLQEANDLFLLSQEAAGAGSWDLDLRTGAVNLSRENARLHGIADEAVALDLASWRAVVDPEDAERALNAVDKAAKEHGTYWGEFRVRHRSGEIRWLKGIGRAYYDCAGAPTRMIGLNFDVTDAKTAEAKLEEARSSAERASTAKTEFLASMSHEIRTPLNSIIGYTDLLLEDGECPSTVRRKLEVIQESGAALLTIVNDVLDFSKIEAGQVELDVAPFSVEALVDNVGSMLAGLAQRKGLIIKRNVEPGLAAFVLGDESRVRQILLNLANNAIKFTQCGEVSIAVDLARKRGDGEEMVRFAVADTGIGISATQIGRLFQRFSQVDGSIARRFGGTGLGLAICKQLVELMGGTIGVESREGEGSTFWFEVPLPVVAGSQSAIILPAAAADAVSARILLVEDVEVNQELARAVLESSGHSVTIASNGCEAVKLVREHTFDLVLMDVHMPVMDGIAATQAIRESEHESRSVPIIAMTANVLPQQVASLKEAGMDDHVGKPFKRADLDAAIARWARAPVAPPAAPTDETLDDTVLDSFRDLVGEKTLLPILRNLAAELRGRFVDLESKSPDRLKLAEDAHAMISASGMLGFKALADLCREVEVLCRSNLELGGTARRLADARTRAMDRLSTLTRSAAV